MNISGIYPVSGFYRTNPYAVARPDTNQINEEAEEIGVESPAEVEASSSKQTSAVDARANQTFGAYDYANQYRPEDRLTSRLSGVSIRSNDVEKAISDMQKDNALHQYQYFVKESQGAKAGTSPITMRGAEDFTL